MSSPTPAPVQGQFDFLAGSLTLQFTADYTDSRSLSDVSTSWGTTTIMTAPQLQWTAPTPTQPEQFAVVTNLINQAWPTLGPFAIQTALQVGFQASDGTPAATVAPQLDLALAKADQIHIQGSVQVTLTPDGKGGLAAGVSLPATVVFTGVYTF